MQVSKSQAVRITKQQLEEWIENPVTIFFRQWAEEEKESCEMASGIDVYHVYQPQRTQEILAGLNGCVDTWDLVIAALEGDG